MKVFVTGASGFIGSAVVRELVSAGHQVTGLARSEKSAKIVSDLGAKILKGDLEDLEILKQGALQADGVIHCGFNHDFMTSAISTFAQSSEGDKKAINAMGDALIGTDKPIVVAHGVLGQPLINGFVTEESNAKETFRFSELTALALAEKGVHASVVRLAPSVHGTDGSVFVAGFVTTLIEFAKATGISAYAETGSNRWPAVHRLDAAKVFRLALEKSAKGALYNAIGESGIEVKKIAELIADKLNLPAVTLSGEELAKHFEWFSHFIQFDSPATNFKTQEALGWKPAHIGLLEDLQENYN